MANDLLEALCARIGSFTGEGTNHEGERFIGRLEIESLPGGYALLIRYLATRDDGLHLHREATLLGRLADTSLCLWPVMEELPFVAPHPLLHSTVRADDTRVAVFASGAREATAVFREEITIEISALGVLTYSHAWGLPAGTFAARSRCVLRPLSKAT